MDNKSDISDTSDIAKDTALKVVKDILESSIENIILERKVSTSPCLTSICEEVMEEVVEATEELDVGNIGMDEVGMDEVRMDEVRMDEVRMDEVGMDEVGMDEVEMEISVDCDVEITHNENVGENCCCSLWRW